MKKLLVIFGALALLGSCSSEQAVGNEKTTLLTAVSWKTGPTNDYSVDKFNADGTFTMNFNEIPLEVRGSWEWISSNEISLFETEITIDGVTAKVVTKPSNKTIIRIINLSEDRLLGISHHFLDAEDSGFEKKITYTAE